MSTIKHKTTIHKCKTNKNFNKSNKQQTNSNIKTYTAKWGNNKQQRKLENYTKAHQLSTIYQTPKYKQTQNARRNRKENYNKNYKMPRNHQAQKTINNQYNK